MPGPPTPPPVPLLACWRLVPSAKGSWQGGILSHDPDLGGWSWDDQADPESLPPDTPSAYWTPPLFDAHTHVGDAFLRPERDQFPRDLASLVGPGGIKHTRLAETDSATQQQAMTSRLGQMLETGTQHLLDFREGGTAGASHLLKAASAGPAPGVSILARPAAAADNPDAWIDELHTLVAAPLFGIGLSAMRDLPGPLLDQAADACRATNRPLALHLSEGTHEDMERALALGAQILVHLNHATPTELADAADAGALAVSCPASNQFFAQRPPIAALVETWREHNLAVAFGTDNAMLSNGELKDDARLITRAAPEAPLAFLLEALTWTPWRHLNLGPDPTHPGLLWGIHRKAPTTHPLDTPLAHAAPLLNDGPFTAPPI